ncbi:MAG: cold shock domain-containing protein [Sulfuricaulis sp.]|nr:cold shock domain-containing protein [Sulfuricaulis sp.]
MNGVIKKLVKDKRFGFIKGEDGKEYFFHQSVLKNVRYEELEEGR